MIEFANYKCSLDEVLILSDAYEECHTKLSGYEGRLYFKDRYKFVYSRMMQNMNSRMQIAADLGQFEEECMLPLSESLICYMGLEVKGYYSHYTSDYEKLCEIARLYADEYQTAIYIAPHFKEVKPGTVTRLTEHVHILYHNPGCSFEDYVEKFIDKFEDNEK